MNQRTVHSVCRLLLLLFLADCILSTLFAAAACMFFAARSFRITEDKKEDEKKETETEHEKES